MGSTKSFREVLSVVKCEINIVDTVGQLQENPQNTLILFGRQVSCPTVLQYTPTEEETSLRPKKKSKKITALSQNTPNIVSISTQRVEKSKKMHFFFSAEPISLA